MRQWVDILIHKIMHVKSFPHSYFPGTILKQVGHFLSILSAHRFSNQIKVLCNSVGGEKEVSL